MASLSNWHQVLTDGVGKCSVPMWMGGCPAGFCDEPAYGPQEKNQTRYGEYQAGMQNGRWFAGGVWFPGYCSGLACYNHGGPAKPIVATEMVSERLVPREYVEEDGMSYSQYCIAKHVHDRAEEIRCGWYDGGEE